jgi:hypothetical protein
MSNADRCRRYQDRRRDHVNMIGEKLDVLIGSVNTLFDKFQQLIDHVDTVSPNGFPLKKGLPHTPSKETTPFLNPSDSPNGESRRSAFDLWWEGYPEKVGKGDAKRAFVKALTKTSLDQLVVGVERYKATKPLDRPWCNPATWLNQERWLDVPAANGNSQLDISLHTGPTEPPPGFEGSWVPVDRTH